MIAVDLIKQAAPDPLSLARRLGLDIARGARPDRVRVKCPWHNEKHASCALSVRDGHVVAHCFSCGSGGDLLALVAAVHGLDTRHDFRRVAAIAADLVGVSLEADARPVARKKVSGVELLAMRIDAAAEDWLAGRPARVDLVVESASSTRIVEALELLSLTDRRRTP